MTIDEISAKASQRVYFIIQFTGAGVEPHHLARDTTLIRSVIGHACQVWHNDRTKTTKTIT